MTIRALFAVAIAVCAAGVRATEEPRDVTLKHKITWVDTLPPSYKLAGVDFISHGWDVVADKPMPTPIFQFHYDGVIEPQSNAPKSPKTMEMMGSNDVFFIPDECEAKPHGSCEFSATSEVYTSSTKYARSTAVSAGIGVELAMLGAFSASVSVEAAREGMEEGEKDMFILKAECLASGVELTKPTSFHPSFVTEFKELPTTFGPEDGNAEWKSYRKFFDVFGTHVITRADLGGVLQQTTFISKSTVASKSSSAIAASLEASLSAGFVSASASVGGSHAREDSSESSSSSMDSKITTFGGQPGSVGDGSGAAWGSWAATVPTHPVPLHRRMTSLGELLGYDPTTSSATGEAAQALCKLAGDMPEADCNQRIGALYRGTRRYVKERSKGQSTTYAVYVHFANADEEAGGPQDPARERPLPADIPSSVRETLPPGALDRLDDKVKVCSFECRTSTFFGSDPCEPGMPPVRVLESQAKGCATTAKNSRMTSPEVSAICQARNSACNSKEALLTEIKKMSALEAAGVVDARVSGSQKALNQQLLSTTICEIGCLADDPWTGKAKPCMNGDQPRIAYVPETALPKCHVSTEREKLTSKSSVLDSAQFCGGCGVPNKGRFYGSFIGDPKNPTVALEEQRKLAALPSNERVTNCEYECDKCPSAEGVVAAVPQADLPSCVNHVAGQSYGDAKVKEHCLQYGCKGSKAVFLRVSHEKKTGGAPRFARRSVQLSSGFAPQLATNEVARTPRRLSGPFVTVSQSAAAVPAGLRGVEAVGEQVDMALLQVSEGDLPVLSIYGELGEVVDWQLGDNKPDAVVMGKLSKFERNYPGVGMIDSIDLTLPEGFSVRMVRITDVDAGVEYIFEIEGSGPWTKQAPVRMDKAPPSDEALTVPQSVSTGDQGVATADVSSPAVSLDDSTSKDEENLARFGGDQSQGQAEGSTTDAQSLLEVSTAVTPVPTKGEKAMSNLYAQLDVWRSTNRYDFFIVSSASQFINERGDLVLTLTGDSGSISIPVSVYQERYWELLGGMEKLPDSDLPNALYVKSRTPLFRNFKQAGDKDRQRIGFFGYEGSGVGALRKVQLQVRKAVRPTVMHVKEAPYKVQSEVAQQICSALLGTSSSAKATDDCTTLTGENPSTSKWPNMAFIMRDKNVVGLGAAQCEAVKQLLERGNDRFQCQFEKNRWFRYAQTPDYSRSTKKLKKLVGAGFSATCDGHGKINICESFFGAEKGYFVDSDSEIDLSNMRYVNVQEIKVVDYRARRAYYAQFDSTVNEFASATRDLL